MARKKQLPGEVIHSEAYVKDFFDMVVPSTVKFYVDHYICGDSYRCVCGVFTKTICEARNRNQLMKAVEIAKELGLKEGIDFFLIKDCCLTELEPEEVDENGVGRTLTCIGFKPLTDDIAHQISKKYQLYK